MSVANDLLNHVDIIRAGLSTLSLLAPDRVMQILDTRARYKTSVAGAETSELNCLDLGRNPNQREGQLSNRN